MILQEGAIAFIRLCYNILAFSGFGIRAYIDNLSADNVGRISIAGLHHQRDHRGGGGFTVGTGNRNAFARVH
ncbi:hypothetical protein D3C79_1036960 [compost metagenome]